jgi:hypothetical protein
VGIGFPSGQTRSVCPEIMLNLNDLKLKSLERDRDLIHHGRALALSCVNVKAFSQHLVNQLRADCGF